jgi:hypothetical protein
MATLAGHDAAWMGPSMNTLGNSNTPGVLDYVMPLLHWAMPSKYHSIHKNDLARAMVAQSEQALLTIAQGNARKEATVKIERKPEHAQQLLRRRHF